MKLALLTGVLKSFPEGSLLPLQNFVFRESGRDHSKQRPE